jgi:chromosome segregation ATPase
MLVHELDDSEAQTRDLRVRLALKDNLLTAMLHREKVLDIDLNERKQQLAAITAHIAAVESRVDRLKKERRTMELMAQKHQYDSAATSLGLQVNEVASVQDALDTRVQNMQNRLQNTFQDEVTATRRSLQPAVASGTEPDPAASQSISAATSRLPPPPSLLQRSSRKLRGAGSQLQASE